MAQHRHLHWQEPDGVPVSRAALEIGHPDPASTAGPVLDDDGLPEVGLHLLGQGAGGQVRAAAGARLDDEGQILLREVRRRGVAAPASAALGAGTEGKARHRCDRCCLDRH
jgi:hypothetical protein